jgi:hypothetical protein
LQQIRTQIKPPLHVLQTEETQDSQSTKIPKKKITCHFSRPLCPPAEETVVTWRELQASLLDQRFKIRQLFEIQKVSNSSNFQKFGKN